VLTTNFTVQWHAVKCASPWSVQAATDYDTEPQGLHRNSVSGRSTCDCLE